MVEAMYDLKSGKTFVRHPEKEDEWLDCELLGEVVQGHPVSTVSGRDACDVFSSMPHGHKRVEPKRVTLLLISKGHHSELD